MTVWGVDLGVRSVHVAGLVPDGSLELVSHVIKAPKKVAEQPPEERARELISLAATLTVLVAPGDLVFIEEPPAAGSKNLRTYLKLSQASAAAAIGAQAAAAVVFVPVDTWKKGTVGRGGTSKELVAAWLECAHPAYARQCAGDQNLIDATAIALYGHHGTRAAAARRADSPHGVLAAR